MKTTHNFRYRYTCEHCHQTTDWVDAELCEETIDNIGMSSVMGSGGSSGVLSRMSQNMVEEDRRKQLIAKKIELLKEIFAKSPPYVIENEFLEITFNDSFSQANKCPFCDKQQSWYPANKKLSHHDSGVLLSKPEIDWQESAPNVSETVDFVGSVQMQDQAQTQPLTNMLESASKSTFEDYLLQILDFMMEHSKSESFIKRLNLESISVTDDNGLVFDDNMSNLYELGNSLQDSINTIILLIKTSGFKSQYKKIIKNELRYETLEEVKKDIEKSGQGVVARNGAIIFLIIMGIFVFNGFFNRVIGPFIEAIKNIFGF